ncbi:cytochrome P450 oxidoreductase [Tothia fuscella]|uniref:Cytochrome P450 oxidoreductase n=1 Tax=Tothia fuscella TaxID=1048955 RepID=A0A9P4U1P5_9PEZI|nr:cytochrome P450 oxidoreductase [Tothia fuscella]
MLTSILPFLKDYWAFVLSLLILLFLLRNKYFNGLHKYPGPALAAYTNWWRFFDALNRRPEKTHIELHKQHGDIVRLGPNVLSFADPKTIKEIYGLNKGFTKSEFYPVQSAISPRGKPLPSLFSTIDEKRHAQYRRCVNSVFSMTSLIHYEPLVDSTTRVFLSQTEKLFSATGESCNFARWLQYYAFDVIGEITWGRRVGFLEGNEDVGGIVEFVADFLAYVGPVGQMPILDSFLNKNVLKLKSLEWGLRKEKLTTATKFAVDRASERVDEMQTIKEKGLEAVPTRSGSIDFLSKFTQAQHDHPEFMTDDLVLTSCLSMIFAGSETTAISLSAIFYYLIKNPRVYAKLMTELDNAVESGAIIDRSLVTWAESQKLPYLDAVIQEAFRMHPAPGLIMERTVPDHGAEILGEMIPGGTIVGCNAWVLHRRAEIFGDDADVFRPERWIEASPGKLKEMKATMFQFGAGARTCIGKNVSLLEIYKVVPAILGTFEIVPEQEGKEWTTHNAWFVRQLDFRVKFRRRSDQGKKKAA